MTTLDDELQDAIERGDLEPKALPATLYDLVEIVRQSRERTNDVFPLPDAYSCIDYAITEAGEYLDAILREKRNGDKRNNSKEHDARKELGQSAYMVCSAIIQIENDVDLVSLCQENTIYDMLVWLCFFRTGDDGVAHVDALQVYVNLCMADGYDPVALLRETCAAFEAKHLPQPFRYPVLSAEDAAQQGEQGE